MGGRSVSSMGRGGSAEVSLMAIDSTRDAGVVSGGSATLSAGTAQEQPPPSQQGCEAGAGVSPWSPWQAGVSAVAMPPKACAQTMGPPPRFSSTASTAMDHLTRRERMDGTLGRIAAGEQCGAQQNFTWPRSTGNRPAGDCSGT